MISRGANRGSTLRTNQKHSVALKSQSMRIVFLISVLLFAFVIGSSQTVDVSKISEAGVRLEALQKELWQVDQYERSEIEALNRQSFQKGEFETTKQF